MNKTVAMLVKEAKEREALRLAKEQAEAEAKLQDEQIFLDNAAEYIKRLVPPELFQHLHETTRPYASGSRFECIFKYPDMLDIACSGFLPKEGVNFSGAPELEFSLDIPYDIHQTLEDGFFLATTVTKFASLSEALYAASKGYIKKQELQAECDAKNAEFNDHVEEYRQKRLAKSAKEAEYNRRFEGWREKAAKFSCVDPTCIMTHVLIDIAESLYYLRLAVEERNI